jgi:hypothetical protein
LSEGELDELRSRRDALAERFGQHYLSPMAGPTSFSAPTEAAGRSATGPN